MKANKRTKLIFNTVFIYVFISIFLISCKKETSVEKIESTKSPNVVIIYMDDLGYGDVSFNGASTIHTPNMDKLANNGVIFTNGYAAASTCTPSRYSLLTGVYPWREKDAKILPGTAPLLIKPNQVTLPKILKSKGYHTGIVGKWHLGLGTGIIDWNETIKPGPNEVGFDYSYIMAATQDRVPTVYIKNGDVVGLEKEDPIEVSYEQNFDGEPTGKENPELTKMKWHHGHNNSIVNGIPRIGFMKGGEKAKWIDEDMADNFLNEAKNYVKEHKEKPFFLYYALQQPHVPRTPNKRFVGKSGMGPRGDVILEADWCVGEFIKTLEEQGILENTLIIFSSDNGPVINDGYYDEAEEKIGNHNVTAGLRGGKYSLYEAGTRVPFFTYWKGTIKPGVSDAIVSQIDIFSSIAKLIGSSEKTNDSVDLLAEFLGNSEVGREDIILQGSYGTFIRENEWVMIPKNDTAPSFIETVKIETGISKEDQLYNLKEDFGQQENVASKYPEKLKELKEKYELIRYN